MLVIGVSGLIGSGKDTFANYLEENGFKKIVMGDLARQVAEQKHLTFHRRVLQNIQKQEIKKYGKYYWINKAIKKVKLSRNKVVIAGLRHIEDVLAPKKEFGKRFIVVFITADQKLRFERLRGRRRTGDPKTLKEFQEQDKKEKQLFDFDKIKKQANYTINNSKGYDKFYKRVEEILAKIEKS